MAELWEGSAGDAGDTGLCWAPLAWGVTGLSVGTPGWPQGELSAAPSRDQGQKAAGETWGRGEQCPAPLRVCPLLPHAMSLPQWHCRRLVALGAAPEGQQRGQVMPGTKQLFPLRHNVQGECVFPKGNWSRNIGVRRSCLVKIVNKSP